MGRLGGYERLEAAEALLKECKELLDETGDPDRLYANWYYRSGLIQRQLSNSAGAIEFFDQSIEVLKREYGECPLMARIYLSKNNLYNNQGQSDKAYPNAVISYEMYKRVLGPDHGDTLRALRGVDEHPEYRGMPLSAFKGY
eukprot:GFYU01022584.1.p1 GENE.GFYU01022584.1~~GFYU01022584.1.p1  ORF type:complete len:142 (-),score=21.01 GFYU01022584.1:113-538(-)